MCFRPPAMETKKKCPACGFDNDPEMMSCVACGAELAAPTPGAGVPGAPAPAAPGAPKAPSAPPAPGSPR